MKRVKKEKKLSPIDIEYIKMVYKQILYGQATRSNITKAYYLLTQINVQEEQRMTAIIKFVEDLN